MFSFAHPRWDTTERDRPCATALVARRNPVEGIDDSLSCRRPVSGLTRDAEWHRVIRLPTLSRMAVVRSGSLNHGLDHRCGGSAGFTPASRFTHWPESFTAGGTCGGGMATIGSLPNLLSKSARGRDIAMGALLYQVGGMG